MSGEIKLTVGSLKEFKIENGRLFLAGQFVGNGINGVGADIKSQVDDQPRSIETTIQGAMNRSVGATNYKNTHFGFGLEGGVFFDNETDMPFLIEVAAITIKTGDPYTQVGVSNPFNLPAEFAEPLRKGILLDQITQKYFSDQDINISLDDIHKNGTAFYFSNGEISRDFMMQQALERAMDKLDNGIKTNYLTKF